jgi:hypothetical protein
MEKKVIHRLPIHFAHTTSINHNDTLLSEIVEGEDLPLRCRPSEESHFQGNLGPPCTFPGKLNILFASKNLIERSNIKFPFVRRRPPELVFPITIHSSWVQQREKGGQNIHLSVVSRSKEANLPLIGPAPHNQMVCNMCILVTRYVIQNWESYLKGHLTTPHIVPKTDPRSISQNEYGMVIKQTPPLPNILPKPHSVWPRGGLKNTNQPK